MVAIASTAAVLNILVNANTGGAIAALQAVDAQAHKTAATANKTSSKVGAAFAKWGKAGAAGGALAIGFALFSATKKTMEFEKQMSSLQATSSATRREMAQLEKQAIKMGAATVFSATEAAQAQIELAKGGLSVKQILGGGLRSALALAAAGELDLAEAATTTVNAMKLFEIGGRRSMRVADMLATAANTTTADVRDFAMALSQGGSVAKQAGYNLNETVVVLEALAEAGIKNSDAGTSMKAAFVQLLGPTAKQKALVEQLGMSFVDQNGQLKDAAGLANELRHGLAGMSDAQRAATLKTLAGTDGFRALAALYDAGAEKLDGFSKANRRQGTAAETARKKNNNLRGDLEQLSGAWETLQIIVGKKVTPILRDVAKWLTSVVRVVSALTGKSKRAGEEAEKFRDKNQALIAVMRIVWAVMKGVYNIFRLFYDLMFNTGKALKRLRTIAGNVAEGMRAVFDAAWLAIRTTFREGANAVIGIVNTIIGVLNKIPGVDIGKVGIILDPNIGKDANGPSLGRQRGGPIWGGKPSGDSIPAMLERGEYVLNRKAVQKVGRKQLDAVNFGAAPRFQKGGVVGLNIGGDVVEAAAGAAAAAGKGLKQLPGVGAAASLLSKGPQALINLLPDPNIPQPFTGVGPWIVQKAEEFIKNRVKKALASGGGKTRSYPGLSGDTDFIPALGWALSRMARSTGTNISVTSGWRSYAEQAALYQAYLNGTGNLAAPPGSSNHEDGRAADISPGSEVFGGVAGNFGLGFTVPGESWHIELLKRGGLVGLMRGGPAEHAVVRNVGKFLLNRGFDFRAAAGILGNAWREGLWNPAQMEFTGAHNGGLYGFTTSPVSLQDMKNFASRRGKRWDDEIVQTNFMLSHGNPPGIQLRGPMNALETIAQTTEHFMSNWERPLASAAGLSERVAAGHDASNILRAAGIVRAGSDGGGKSEQEQRRDERASRKDARNKRVRDLIKKAFGAKSAQAKKGAFWQILDLYAKYGDFESRGSRYGGAGPGLSEAATFLGRAGQIASIANPNRGAGQLYNLVKWLQGNVDLTGAKEANDAMSDRLAKVRKSGGARAQKRRQKIHKRLAKYGTDFPWKEALNKNARTDEILDDLSNILSRDHQADWSEFGSEYSPAELKKEQGVLHKLFATRDNRYRMLMRAIPWAEKAQKFYEGKVRSASSDPAQKWMLPGYRKGLNSVKGLLNGGTGNFSLREDLKTLVGAAGVAGLSAFGGTRGDAYSRWLELNGTKAGGPGSSGIGISDLLQIVEAAKYGVYDRMPQFHTGGVVPGTGERPAMVMGGEGIFTREQMAAMGAGNLTIDVNFRDERLKDLISFEIRKSDRAKDQQHLAGVGR